MTCTYCCLVKAGGGSKYSKTVVCPDGCAVQDAGKETGK